MYISLVQIIATLITINDVTESCLCVGSEQKLGKLHYILYSFRISSLLWIIQGNSCSKYIQYVLDILEKGFLVFRTIDSLLPWKLGLIPRRRILASAVLFVVWRYKCNLFHNIGKITVIICTWSLVKWHEVGGTMKLDIAIGIIILGTLIY